MISNSSYKPNFPPELLLNNSQAAKLYKVLSNNLSFNIKFLNTQVSKTGQSGGKINSRISRKCSWTIDKNWFTIKKTFVLTIG